MLKIERQYNQFRISVIGERFSVMAEDLEQVNAAVSHYYAGRHDYENCPFCKHLTKVVAKERRRARREQGKADGQLVPTE